MNTHYDLIIIGTGSGNSLPDDRFDDKRIAIVEKGTFGGTCLNVGCIPTKMYVYAADVAYDARHAAKLGLDIEYKGADWDSIVSRIFTQRIDPIATGGEAYRRGPETPNIDVYDGHATFTGPKTITTAQGDTPVTITGDQIVIATGSRPVIPEPIATSGVTYRTNEDIMRLEKQPESLIIYGGGYIAMEFAHVFDSLGTKVHIVARSPQLLRHLDDDIATRFNDIAYERFDVHGGRTIAGLTQEGNQVVATLDDGTTIHADEILVATGRVSTAEDLNPEAGGVQVKDGRIAVDEYGRSVSAEGVWALGDVSSPYQLKHVANAEARAVQHNLLNPDDLRLLPHDLAPAAIFTHPQIATVGLTEEEALQSGLDIAVKIQAYGDVAFGWAMEDTTGIVKLIGDKATGRLVGAHLMGPQASTLIQQLITIMAYKIGAREVARSQYWIHPALPEVIENALLGLPW